MIELLGPTLRSLGVAVPEEGAARLVAALALWLALGLALELAARLIRLAGRRTASELDDVLVAEARSPLWAALVFAAVIDEVGPYADAAPWSSVAALARVGLVAAITWLVQRLVLSVLLRAAEGWGAHSESALDDMLIPIIRTFVRPIAIVVGGMFALDTLGVPIGALAVVIGGASFILAFALQGILADIFGGISLLVDTPFTYGDVLQLEDGTICQVKTLGMRVTGLYNAVDHTTIAMPNSQLAGQKIVNLTRPSADVRLTIDVNTAEESDVALVRRRLLEAANGHPWVLGQNEAKLEAMRRRVARLIWKDDVAGAVRAIKEMNRVRAEGESNAAIEALATHLVAFASRAHHMEAGYFDESERAEIDAGLKRMWVLIAEVKETLTIWMLMVRYSYVEGRAQAHPERAPEAALASLRHALHGAVEPLRAAHPRLTDEALIEVERAAQPHLAVVHERVAAYDTLCRRLVHRAMHPEPTVAAAVCVVGDVPDTQGFFALQGQEHAFAEAAFGAGLAMRAMGGIPDLDDAEEYIDLFLEWNRKMRWLERRASAAEAEYRRGSGMRLDESLYELRRWIATDFKESTPEWKYPRASLTAFEDGLVFTLGVYVDSVKLSHFARPSQTANQLRLEILHLFREHEPQIDFGVADMAIEIVGRDRDQS